MTPNSTLENPPAFPRQGQPHYDADGRALPPFGGHGWASDPQDGLSLCDWFAGQALAGLLASGRPVDDETIGEAITAGRAMLRAREVKP